MRVCRIRFLLFPIGEGDFPIRFSHFPIGKCDFPIPALYARRHFRICVSWITKRKASLTARALEKAFIEDEQVLVEEFISGKEFTIGVFKSKGEIVTLPFTEVKTKKDFFDFEAKYTAGMSEEVTPAACPIAMHEACTRNAEFAS